MQLSVIIPVLNEQERLSALLPMLKGFQSSNIEYIVIDAPSSNDSSLEVCELHDVKYIKATTCGRAVQMNQAATQAKGEILMFLHAIVTPPANFYSLIISTCSTTAKMGFFAYQFDPSTKWLDINSAYTHRDGFFAGGGDQIHFMLKSTFNELGGYDESYVIMEDFALIRKVRSEKIPYSIITERATVSSRKYDKNSYLWVNAVNFFVFLAFKIGVKPQKLKTIYNRALAS